MKSRVTHLKWITVVLALAAVLTPTTAMASKPEAKQVAAYLNAVVNPQPTPADSGRAEAKAFADFLGVTTAPSSPTPADSGRAEAKAFADFLGVTTAPSSPTPVDSGPAETKAIADYALARLSQPQATVNVRAGFDWGDAAIGAGFVGGLSLLASGVALALRRRRVATHLAH